jgi:hypothetical protein
MDAHDQGARPNGLISTPSGHSRLSWQFAAVSDSKQRTLLRRLDQGVVNGLRAASGVP